MASKQQSIQICLVSQQSNAINLNSSAGVVGPILKIVTHISWTNVIAQLSDKARQVDKSLYPKMQSLYAAT